MDSEKILMALEERDRWRERESNLREEMKSLPRNQKREKRQELELVMEQVAYYDALARDMKKSVKPSKIPQLLNTLIKY